MVRSPAGGATTTANWVEAAPTRLRGASWQRCRTHFIRNLLTRVPKAAHGIVATYVRTIFAQPDAESVRAQHARTVEHLRSRFPKAADMLDEAAEELLALPLIFRQFLEEGRAPDEATAWDLLEAVRIYNQVPRGAETR